MFTINHEVLRKEISTIWYFEGKVDSIMQVIRDREDMIVSWMEKASPCITLSDIRISNWYWENDRETYKSLFSGQGNIMTELDDTLEKILQLNMFAAENMGYNVYRWKKTKY